MVYEAQKIGEIEDGTVYRVVAPLDKQLDSFRKLGIVTLVTPEQVAQIRLANISNDWSRTNVAPIARKGARTILAKDSPLMNPWLARAAVMAHRNGEYLEMQGAYDVAESIAKEDNGLEPEDRRAIIVPQDGDFQLSPEMELSRFSLGKHTQEYA